MLLRPQQGGLVLKVKVVPGASRTRIAGVYGEGLKITVAAAPEKGAANAAVLKLLAEKLGTSTANLHLLSGHTNARKEILILSLTADQIQEALI